MSAAVECFNHAKRLSIPAGLWFCTPRQPPRTFFAWLIPPFALPTDFCIKADGTSCVVDVTPDVPDWIRCVFERFGVLDLMRECVVDFEIPKPARRFDTMLTCEFSGRPASVFSSFFWSSRQQIETPAFNMMRVTRSDNVDHFRLIGYTQYRHIQTLIDAHAPHATAILDWGCGAARIARHFLAESPYHVVGLDVDPYNIEWCRRMFDAADFRVVDPQAPTSFPDAAFDVIYGVSVFTHLNRESEHFWLGELRRLLKPGGLAVMSVHGETAFFETVNDFWAYRRLIGEGFLDVGACPDLQVNGQDTISAELYRNVFHTRPYIEHVWGEQFRIVDYIQGSSPAHQDYVVLTTRP